MKRLQEEEDVEPAKRVAIVKTLHIPSDVLLEMLGAFMDERGLSVEGYEFVRWDVHMEPILVGNRMEPMGEDPVFKGVVLQKMVVQELSKK
jgi:hypothetical protein